MAQRKKKWKSSRRAIPLAGKCTFFQMYVSVCVRKIRGQTLVRQALQKHTNVYAPALVMRGFTRGFKHSPLWAINRGVCKHNVDPLHKQNQWQTQRQTWARRSHQSAQAAKLMDSHSYICKYHIYRSAYENSKNKKRSRTKGIQRTPL